MSQLKEKIYEILKQPALLSFATESKGKPYVRYVVGWALEDLTIMFATSIHSNKVAHINENEQVNITVGATDMENVSDYLQIQGKAAVSVNPKLKEACWNPALQEYFSGPDDPAYAIVVTKPYKIDLFSMTDMAPQTLEL